MVRLKALSLLLVTCGVIVAGEHCSPSVSFLASQALEEHVFEWLRNDFGIRGPDALPTECDMLPWKDINHRHNSMREPTLAGRKWFKCKSCSKQFKTAEYLDKHIRDRHILSQPSDATAHTGGNVCLANFCSFIPCDAGKPTLISSLHVHHPERVRAAHLCREVLSRCLPPSISKQFKLAHETLESHFCDGTKRERSNKTAGVSLASILSWIVAIGIIGFYLYHFCLERSPIQSSKGLGVTRRSTANSSHGTETPPRLLKRRTIGSQGQTQRVESTQSTVPVMTMDTGHSNA
jgi:hypothetical protein